MSNIPHATITKSFHAQICLSEALDALNCDCFSPEYKVARIKDERADYIEAFYDKRDADESVIRQFDKMLTQLPK